VRSGSEDGGLFSSDEEIQQSNCAACLPNSMRAVSSCLLGNNEPEELVEDPESLRKPSGLFGEKTFK